jgi:hypothetical protein
VDRLATPLASSRTSDESNACYHSVCLTGPLELRDDASGVAACPLTDARLRRVIYHAHVAFPMLSVAGSAVMFSAEKVMQPADGTKGSEVVLVETTPDLFKFTARYPTSGK